MRLTVIGKSPSWQDRDGACSGYLVQTGEQALLIDCGNGVFAKLRRHADYERVDAVVISHLHADHILDLVPFAYALTYGPALRGSPPELHVPPGAGDVLRRVCGAWGSETLIEEAFELREYDPSAELVLGALQVRFQPVPHYVPSNALELRTVDREARFVFSGDCGPNADLAAFAQGAELLLIEATMIDEESSGGGQAGHLTAAQAGAIGEDAGVRRLVLTHFSDQLDSQALRAGAASAFGGEIVLAAEGAVFEI